MKNFFNKKKTLSNSQGQQINQNTSQTVNQETNQNTTLLTNEQIVEKAINQHLFDKVVKKFKKNDIDIEEIKKLSPSTIMAIGKMLETGYIFPTSCNHNGIFTESKKITTWGDYDVYQTKFLEIDYKDEKHNNKVFVPKNYLLIVDKNQKVCGTVALQEKTFNPNFVDALVVKKIFDCKFCGSEKINPNCMFAKLIDAPNETASLHILTKKGKYVFLYKTTNQNCDIPNYLLTQNDKITKSTFPNIERYYKITDGGFATPISNWKIEDDLGEIIGIKSTPIPPTKPELNNTPDFDITKDYGDIKLISKQVKNNFEIPVDEENEDNDSLEDIADNNNITAYITKIIFNPKEHKTEIITNILTNIRMEKIFNADGEVERISFYDKNNLELNCQLTKEKEQNKLNEENFCQ